VRYSRLAAGIASPSNRFVWWAFSETRVALQSHSGVDKGTRPTSPLRARFLGRRGVCGWMSALALRFMRASNAGRRYCRGSRTSRSRSGFLGLWYRELGRARSGRGGIYDDNIGIFRIIVRVQGEVYSVMGYTFIRRLVRLPLGQVSGSTCLLVSSAPLSSLWQNRQRP
jgi:hypothetical protein